MQSTNSLCVMTPTREVCFLIEPIGATQLEQDQILTQGLYSSARNYLRSAICPSTTTPLLPGENHLFCANYTGPGTNIDTRIAAGIVPTSASDACSQVHDLAYQSIGNGSAPAGFNVRGADQNLLNCYRAGLTTDQSALNIASTAVAYPLIRGKMVLEDLGLLSPSSFINTV